MPSPAGRYLVATSSPWIGGASWGLSARWSVRCAGSWIGQTLSIRGLEETRTSALVRIELDDGRVLQTLLSAAAGSYTVPSRAIANVITPVTR